jgi:hypothetical protein
MEREVKKELKKFRDSEGIDMKDCPLAWWRKHKSSFPHLARVARKWLAVPASSAGSERLFSAAGNIMTGTRTRLSGERLGDIVFLKLSWESLLAAGHLW